MRSRTASEPPSSHTAALSLAGAALLVVSVLWLVPYSVTAFVVALLAAQMLMRPRRSLRRLRVRWWVWRFACRWPQIAWHCRLASPKVPRIKRVQHQWPHILVKVRPAPGQTLEDFQQSAEAMRSAYGAARLRIEPVGAKHLLLRFTVKDELRKGFTAGVRSSDLRSVVVGRTETGAPWRLPIGPHTLVAGCSGSGKGSVFWSFAFGLAPAVQAGTVQLHGIDLKGGMEVLMGRPLFTTTATDPPTAVASLERLVGLMQERSREYAGNIRSHEATPDAPLHVVMVDELAALTAYSSERELQRRAEAAINLLCSQGRAVGFVVFACLQDPRKEVIPSRGLFTQMVGLRLKDVSETTMVLGELADQSGAWCHRITRDVPGTGYVLPEDGTAPIRVRAGYASDELIRKVAAAYATPTVIELEPVALPERDRPRRPKSATHPATESEGSAA